MTLPPAQVESYARDGFLSPVAALTREQAAQCLRKLEAFEASVGGPLTADTTDARYRSRTHILLAWVHTLTRHPAILDAVEDLIGPNILVYTSTWFIKEPESPAIAAWHQDATYFGLRPYEHVTAWLALTDATAENGCMEFLPGSHLKGQQPHRAGVVAASVNRAGQAVVGAIDDAPAVHAPLQAGEFSLHHTLCLHRSQPNRSADAGSAWPSATSRLMCSTWGSSTRRRPCWSAASTRSATSTSSPRRRPISTTAARAAYDRSYEGYRAAYAEQVALEGR